MSEMIERVAKAIKADIAKQLRETEFDPEQTARVAIAAMSEPTPEMIAAGEVAPHGFEGSPFFEDHRRDDHKAIWCAMIGAVSPPLSLGS